MKQIKRIMAVMLTILMVLTLAVPAASAAPDTQGMVYVDVSAGQDVPNPVENVTPGIDWDGVKTALISGFEKREENIDLSSFKIPYVSSVDEKGVQYLDPDKNPNFMFLQNIFVETPRLHGFFKGFSFNYRGDDSGLYISAITPNYCLDTADEYKARVKQCEYAMETLLYGVKGNDALSEYEKCLIVHDRLAAWCEYDTERLDNKTVPQESHCAYGPLVLRISVCEGYAYAYMWMLETLGIEAYYTTSDEINHGWNTVILDGKPYYLDVTFDDPTWDIKGRVTHENFLVSYETFKKNHSDASDYSSAPNDKKYEEGFWTGSSSQICCIGGDYYYIDTWKEGNTKKSALKCWDGDKAETVYSFSNGWPVFDKTGYIYSCLERMTDIGNTVLYSTPTEIHAYDTETKLDEVIYTLDTSAYSEKEYAESYRIYGFTQIDGKLYLDVSYTLSFSADNKPEVITVDYCSHDDTEVLKTIAEPTETGNGLDLVICKDCRRVSEVETLPHTHEWSEWTVTKEATCIATGEKQRTCSTCTEVQTETVAVDTEKHTNTEERTAVAATCISKGREAGTYCKDCKKYTIGGAVKDIDPDNHTEIIDIEAVDGTCTTKGKTAGRKCNGCGVYTVEPAETDYNHANTEERAAVAATCISKGREAGIYCNDCKSYISGGAVKDIDPEKHTNTEEKAAVAATCISKGREAGTYCKDCKSYISGGAVKEIDPENHTNTEERPAITATCITAGREAGTYCKDCKKYTVGGEDLGKDEANHEGGTYVSIAAKAVTCTQDGNTQEVRCNGCRAIITASQVITHEGHKFGNAKVVPATCHSKGYTEYKCLNCTETKKEDYKDVLAHVWKATTVAEPGCETEGYTVNTCTLCGDTVKTDVKAALGHTGGDTCSRCGKVLKKQSFADKIKAFFQRILNFFKNIFKIG